MIPSMVTSKVLQKISGIEFDSAFFRGLATELKSRMNSDELLSEAEERDIKKILSACSDEIPMLKMIIGVFS